MSRPVADNSVASMARVAGRRMLQKRKSLKAILEESERDHSDGLGTLSSFDLLCIGVGSTIGSGVFVLTGKALSSSGPAAIVAWPIAATVCLLSVSSYMELSSRLPTKGSCYSFAYHGLGEVAAVAGAVCVTMEYAVSGAGISRSWSASVYQAMGSWWVLCYNGATAPAPGCNANEDAYMDPLSTALTILCMAVLFKGLDFGKHVITVFTVAKVLVVMFMIIAGFLCWHVNIFESAKTFAPLGAGGVVHATSKLFFGFVGFDEVCCMASRAQNPTRTMPRALIGTILIAGVLSGLAQFSLSTMIAYKEDMTASFGIAFRENGWEWAAVITESGELILLPLVALLAYLPQSEITAAMSEDGVLPSVLSRKSKSTGIYARGLVIIGAVVVCVSACVPFAVLWDLISVGVLLSLNLTNASLINIRYGNGGRREERGVDLMVWSLLGFLCIAGFALDRGVARRLLAGEGLDATFGCIGGASLAAAAIITVALSRCDTKVDMGDARIFKSVGVPFVPAGAIFANFFLISSFPILHILFFLMYLAVALVFYASYVCRRGVKALCDDSDDGGAGSATEDETSEADSDASD